MWDTTVMNSMGKTVIPILVNWFPYPDLSRLEVDAGRDSLLMVRTGDDHFPRVELRSFVMIGRHRKLHYARPGRGSRSPRKL